MSIKYQGSQNNVKVWCVNYKEFLITSKNVKSKNCFHNESNVLFTYFQRVDVIRKMQMQS